MLLWVLSVLVFVFADLAPGDFLEQAQLDPRMNPELLQQLRSSFGLDAPLHIRYARWVGSILKGDGGYSLAYRRPVFELLWPRLLNTLMLTTGALILSWTAALILGFLSAVMQGGSLDRVVLLLTTGLLIIPEILLALAGLWLAVYAGFPLGGTISLDYQDLSGWQRFEDRLRHLVIPVTVLTLAGLPNLVRHVRSAVVGALEEPYVQAARGHGLYGLRFWIGYVLPAAANPLITLFGVCLGALISGGMVVEAVLGWPGLGPMLIESALNGDLHVFNAGLMAGCACLIFGNFLADLLLSLVDPRMEET